MGCSSTKQKLDPKKHPYQFDLVVIGGGTGGLATAREAAKLGGKVAVCDFVVPSPQGTTWGLGGTCVNVGCVPKRLMHQANLIKDYMEDAAAFGWEVNKSDVANVKWSKLVDNVQDYIYSLNFGYRLLLNNESITYINAYGRFENDHTIHLTHEDGKEETITSQCILIAVGTRPKHLPIPGGNPEDKLCITSDDLFTLPYPPGKVLVVGAGYIGMECAGFLAGFGFDVTLMARSGVLRGFDHTVTDLLCSDLEARKVKILKGAHPIVITKVSDGQTPTLNVTYESMESRIAVDEQFNTVLLAVGRAPCTSTLNISAIPKIKMDQDGYILTDAAECAGPPHIFAIGDCAKDRPQLTPPTIRAGHWLARRIFEKKFTKIVNYKYVPTTIFTPLEYGCCGLSEEDANASYGSDNVEVYHRSAVPLEFALHKRDGEAIYAKLVCVRVKKKREKVVGFHYLGPYAGDITVGFSMSIKRECFKEEFNELIAIHPTCAEIFSEMNVSKGSQIAYVEKGC